MHGISFVFTVEFAVFLCVFPLAFFFPFFAVRISKLKIRQVEYGETDPGGNEFAKIQDYAYLIAIVSKHVTNKECVFVFALCSATITAKQRKNKI